ncbi:MAG: hypothetical protein ACLSAH_00875 [Bilophila wadsworthia]
MRWLPFLLVLSLCAALLGCQVEVYGLTEAQVNTMLSTLLKRGIRPRKPPLERLGSPCPWMRISSFSPLKY